MAIKTCGKPNCNSTFQDQKYGHGVRVLNECKTTNGRKWRCSVCLGEHTSGDGAKKK